MTLQLEIPLVTGPGRRRVRYGVDSRELEVEEHDFLCDWLNRHLPRELNVLPDHARAALHARASAAYDAQKRREAQMQARVLDAGLREAAGRFAWKRLRKAAVVVQLEMYNDS